MTTKLITWAIIGVMVLGGGYYVFTKNESTEEAGLFTGSLTDLSTRGGNWKCTVDTNAVVGVGDMHATGTVYVSGKKVRADFVMEVPILGNMQTYMIADGFNVYSWTSATAQGVKSTQTDSKAQTNTQTSGQVVSPYNDYAYDCVPAQIGDEMFAPPSNITFTEVSGT